MTKEDVKGSSIREKKADKKEEEGQRGCLSGQTAAFPSRLTPLGFLQFQRESRQREGGSEGGSEGQLITMALPPSVASISDDTHSLDIITNLPVSHKKT